MSLNETQIKVSKNPVGAVVSSVSVDGTTAKVEVPRTVAHAKYGKRLHLVTGLLVDATGQSVKTGDRVSILPCRKISRLKSWRIVKVLG